LNAVFIGQVQLTYVCFNIIRWCNAGFILLSGLPEKVAKKTLIVIALHAMALSSCSTDQLPVGTHLLVSPTERTIRIIESRSTENRCLLNPDLHVDLPLVITLLDANESPIGDHEISVYLDFSENTFTGYSMLALYQDFNSNGVVDEDEELVSAGDDDIAVVRTHSLYGSQTLLLRVNISCSFTGSIVAIAGGILGTASISIVDEETSVVPEPETET